MPPPTQAKLIAAAAILLPWLGAPLVVSAVVQRNAELGMYGVTDSLLIPIASALMLCAAGCVYLGMLLWRVVRRLDRSRYFLRPLRWPRLAIALLATTPPLLVLALRCEYWWSLEHAPIVAAYALPMLWLLWAATVLAKHDRSTAAA